jgi:adenosine deaminase
MYKIIFIFILFSFENSFANNFSPSQGVDKYLESISSNPQKLYLFFKKMPKGGDLHNHLSGDSYAENLLKYSLVDPVCIDKSGNVISQIKGCITPSDILKDKNKLSKLLDLWSMRNFDFKHHVGRNHFFSVFDKFLPIVILHNDLILAEAVKNASIQHEKYLELMITPDHGNVSKWGKKIRWNRNFSEMRKQLLKNGIVKNIALDSQLITSDEVNMKRILDCNKSKLACKVQINYIYQIFREQNPDKFFAQLLFGFELSSRDSRVVGVNLVEPEDGKIAIRDYDLQMKMLSFLHSIYPTVKIALHAGELTSQFVITNKINNHIRNAIKIGGANRIGHGVDMLFETNYKELLQEMVSKQIAVEVNLTSNTDILGISTTDNPLPLYLKYHVPVVLSTDDEGILRTNLSKEYLIAFTNFKLSYESLKNIDRNSLTYSFLPGMSVWAPNSYGVVRQCNSDHLGAQKISITCRKFLNKNKKASLQWQLERDFNIFESEILETLEISH